MTPPRGDLAVAASILAGSVLIAWSLHRGLRSLETTLDAAASARAVAAPRPTVLELPPAPPSPPPAAPIQPELLERDKSVRRQEVAQALLQSQRAEYAKSCWTPALSGGRNQPPAMRLVVQFDAKGKEAHREVVNDIPPDLRDPKDNAVARCVETDKVPKLHTDATGHPVTMALSLEFP